MLPPTSLVIPSLDRPRLLVETVESVLAGDALPAEIIVVDQSAAPNEELLALNESGRLRYLNVPPQGVSAARNAGIAAAGSEVVAFLDDDVLVEPDFEGRAHASPLYFLNAALPGAAFEEVGGFDARLGPGTRFPSGEDADVGFRLLEAGYRIVYAPEAVVVHRAWRSGGEVRGVRWNYGRGQGAFFAKHMSLRDRYILERAAVLVARYGSLVARRLLTDPRRASSDLTYLLGLMSGVIEGSLRRTLRRRRL